MEVIVGKVISGRGVGRIMGFPTINIVYGGGVTGVYAAGVSIDNKVYLAAVNLGGSPTFDDEGKLCEAFLLDAGLDFDMTGNEEVKVELMKKVRDTVKFHDMESLAMQIAQDVKQVKTWYNAGEISL